ncbi:MAG: polyprenyl synthetase family protein [Clostridia bacterium]|nr:polyprenyl synthetase family protein [Clostridia bacterium]
MKDVEIKLSYSAKAVEPYLEKLLQTPDSELEPLYDAMRYAALGGGKRIRPHLVFEFCRLFGGDEKAALPFAAAIELVHSSSLVHDDMPCMDNDDYRRGRLTCHKVYGEDIALLCGDALITKGYEAAAKNDRVPPEAALEGAMLLLSLAGGEGMMGGQNIDLCSEGKTISFDTLLKMHAKKTGALISAAALLGCVAAGVPTSDARAKDAETYARGVGLAFQIIDDVLDVIGDEKTLGKHTHADAEGGKTTFLSFMSVDDAYEYARRETEKAVSAVKKYDGSEDLVSLAEYLLHRMK